MAYQSWGRLNPERSNAVFIAHALTGDSHVSGSAGAGHRHPGWWNSLVGLGRAIETRRWFVVCSNVLGGCQGTTGPSSPAAVRRPWGSRLLVITVADMVEVERRLTDALGIERWAQMVGPSLGGMRVLEWLVAHPERVAAAVVIGTTAAVGADHKSAAMRLRSRPFAPICGSGEGITTGLQPGKVRTGGWGWPAASPNSATAAARNWSCASADRFR